MIRPVQKQIFAVIGHPVEHSLSPHMMNAVFDEFGIPAVYLALDVDDLAQDLGLILQSGFMGLSVTIPHKEKAFSLSLCTDPAAQRIGAVNTLRRSSNKWEGCNTDWVGAIGALKPCFHSLSGRSALVLGAGGVARAVIYGLKSEDVSVVVCNRGIERGRKLAEAFDCQFVTFEELRTFTEVRPFDLIVQCTSVGLNQNSVPLPVPSNLFGPGVVVLDTIYRPLETAFLLNAKRSGSTVVCGVEMLVRQGLAQLQWWFEKQMPEEKALVLMRNTLLKVLQNG